MKRQGGGIYKDKICTTLRRNNFEPSPHQTYVKDYFLTSTNKGMLLYHKLGSGKTCTSVIIADELLKRNRISKVFVITPGSLRENWINEYCKVCGTPSIKLDKFTFITYNTDVFDQLPRVDFNNSLVIIDEAHNFSNGVKNFSKNIYGIYRKIISSNCRVIVLTGTPIFNDTIEFAIIGSLISDRFNWLIKRAEGEGEEYILDFDRWAELKQNPQILKRLISGLVSYFPGDTKFYPEIRHIDPIKCTMSTEQYKNYTEVMQKEMQKRFPPKIALKYSNPSKYYTMLQQYIVASKWTATRSASNFKKIKEGNFIPDLFVDESKTYSIEEFKKILSIVEDPDPIRVESIIENMKKRILDENIGNYKYIFSDDFKKIKIYGWLTNELLHNPATNLFNLSNKYAMLLTNIVRNLDQKHIIYSFYKESSGTVLLHSLLKHCGIRSVLYTGDVDATSRQRIINNFNKPTNRNGELIQVILLTEAGAEGINLLEVNHVHVVESSTREIKNLQAIGRAIRFKSHFYMPADRQFVNIYRYWSVYPNEVCIDEQLYNAHFNATSGKKQIIDNFQTLLQNYSIEHIGDNEIIGSDGVGNDIIIEENILQLQPEHISITININSENKTVSTPSNFMIQDLTRYLITNFMIPPQNNANVLIDLNSINENDAIVPKNIFSSEKISRYTEDQNLYYIYNIENVDELKFVFVGNAGKITIKDVAVDTTLDNLKEMFQLEISSFLKMRYNDIDITGMIFYTNTEKSRELTSDIDLLIYFLNKIPIYYSIETINPKL